MQTERSITGDSSEQYVPRRRLPRQAGRRGHLDCLPAGRPRAMRGGFSMLELQVALVVFGIALAGLGPLVVMHSRHLRKLEARISPQTTYYLIPPTDPWVRKLGTAAAIATSGSSPGSNGPAAAVNDVQIQSLDKTLESQTVTVWVTVKPK